MHTTDEEIHAVDFVLGASGTAAAVAEELPICPAIHVAQHLEPMPLEIQAADDKRPAIYAYPTDYVLTHAGGAREAMSEDEFESKWRRPKLSPYWDQKREEAKAAVAGMAHPAAFARGRRG